ncbi:hypothetical protein HZA96_02290 [Candidatus Woesearchaeota archaeon]|nr:hypothetical protein [Candidatus Woesearchaeota archaeon]
MGKVLKFPPQLRRLIFFPWLDYDHANLDEIVADLAKHKIRPTFHEAVYPVLDTLLVEKVNLIVLNMSVLPGEYNNNPVIDEILGEISDSKENWKMGKYFIEELRKPYSVNKDTTIFATSYNTNLFYSFSGQHLVAKDAAINAGATQFYNLIYSHQSLTQDIISHFKKKNQ